MGMAVQGVDGGKYGLDGATHATRLQVGDTGMQQRRVWWLAGWDGNRRKEECRQAALVSLLKWTSIFTARKRQFENWVSFFHSNFVSEHLVYINKCCMNFSSLKTLDYWCDLENANTHFYIVSFMMNERE